MSVGEKSTPSTRLERLQRWTQAVITHPGGVAAGVASAEARRSLGVALDTLETVVAPSPKLSGAERLAVYCRSYHARLLQCFREMFPALLRALGGELFDRFALDYLQHHPPRGYSLDRLADAFPRHLAETRPEAAAPPGERESWPDFVVELAALELTFLKVYDGPGLEGRALPRARDIRALDPARVLEARPAPAACLRLFAFRYPVHAYLLAARRGQNPELPAPAESFVAVTRRDYRVRLYELPARQYALLQALDGQRTIGQALNQMTPPAGRQPPPPAAILRNWLCDWVTRGFLESVEVPDGAASLPQGVRKGTPAPAGTGPEPEASESRNRRM